GMIQRSIMFHFGRIGTGNTGWMLSTVRNPSSGPTPFSQLNWNGMLTMSETGFASFFARSWACSPAALAGADAAPAARGGPAQDKIGGLAGGGAASFSVVGGRVHPRGPPPPPRDPPREPP